MSVLYDVVAAGMWTYSRAAFRVTTLAPPFRLRPRSLILVTHRRESDVPVVSPQIYFGARLWRNRSPRMSFAARDDMFLPGFFAGFPANLPTPARRLLFPVGIARWLPAVEVHPLRSASVARLGEVVRARANEPLAAMLAPAEASAFLARAASVGLRAPVRAADVLRGEYADLLWRAVSPADAAGIGAEAFWSRRAAQAATDFRAVVELVRSGGVLVVFPEGRPSPDGEIGPLQRGIAALVRRSEPEEILPVALAYDPLTRGRTRVAVAIGPAEPPPAEPIEALALALLRRTMPLTAGQIVAESVSAGRAAAPLAAEAVDEALSVSRPIEPDLLDRRRRARRIGEALAAAEGAPPAVAFLAREFRSARAP